MKKKVHLHPLEDPRAFRQTVRMAAVQVAGLLPEELRQALAYEVEPVSGISAQEAEIEYRPLTDPDPSVCVYEVAVRRRAGGRARAGQLARFLPASYLFAGVCALVLAADFAILHHRLNAMRREIALRQPLQAAIDREQDALRRARQEMRQLQTTRTAVQAAQTRAEELRNALAQLLGELSHAFGENAVVTHIAGQDFKLEVTARALNANMAADVLSSTTARIARYGWRLTSGPMNREGQTVKFKFTLHHD